MRKPKIITPNEFKPPLRKIKVQKTVRIYQEVDEFLKKQEEKTGVNSASQIAQIVHNWYERTTNG